MKDVRRIDYVVLNTGILKYPNVGNTRTVQSINILMM